MDEGSLTVLQLRVPHPDREFRSVALSRSGGDGGVGGWGRDVVHLGFGNDGDVSGDHVC